ncbi:MAG: hypothetical protein AB4352_24395 [Hormoscilla sp.]
MTIIPQGAEGQPPMSKFSNTLLALFLTLPDLEPPLTPEERKSLNEVGEQLEIAPDHPRIEPNILEIVHANPNWSQLFTATKAKLDGLGGDIPQDLLPSPEEVDRVFPSEDPVERGFPKGGPDDSNYIKNFSVSILTNPDPQSESKKCQKEGLLDKLTQRLRGKGEKG